MREHRRSWPRIGARHTRGLESNGVPLGRRGNSEGAEGKIHCKATNIGDCRCEGKVADLVEDRAEEATHGYYIGRLGYEGTRSSWLCESTVELR